MSTHSFPQQTSNIIGNLKSRCRQPSSSSQWSPAASRPWRPVVTLFSYCPNGVLLVPSRGHALFQSPAASRTMETSNRGFCVRPRKVMALFLMRATNSMVLTLIFITARHSNISISLNDCNGIWMNTRRNFNQVASIIPITGDRKGSRDENRDSSSHPTVVTKSERNINPSPSAANQRANCSTSRRR